MHLDYPAIGPVHRGLSGLLCRYGIHLAQKYYELNGGCNVNTWWRNIIEPGIVFSRNNASNNKWLGTKGEKVELTKVTRPRLNPTYQRTELNTLLDALGATPVITVSGKPGSGKTTLLSNYIESRNLPCLWYRLDRDDQDLATFFYYLGIAALRINPYNKPTLPRVSPERVLKFPSLTKEYFHKLYQAIEAPFMIVFDNYQHVPTEAALQEVITEACAALPPGGRIVIINNSDCRMISPKLRTHRATALLGCEELQLSLAEVKEIASLFGVRLPSDHYTKRLHMKVGGWVAGLVNELHELKDLKSENCKLNALPG